MGTQLCHPPLTAEETAQVHTFGNAPSSETFRTDRKALIHTFLWHAGVSGVVSLLGRLVADGVATLGPPQDAEGPVQPPEGATPH